MNKEQPRVYSTSNFEKLIETEQCINLLKGSTAHEVYYGMMDISFAIQDKTLLELIQEARKLSIMDEVRKEIEFLVLEKTMTTPEFLDFPPFRDYEEKEKSK